LPLFVACTSTLLLSMAFWRTPVVALMPDVTPSRYLSQANGVINFMGGLGFIAATLGGAALYTMNKAYPFWLGSILVVLSALLLFAFVREPKVYSQAEEQPGMWESLATVIQDNDRSAIRLFLAIFFWFLGYAAIEAFFTLYAQKHLGLAEADGPRLLGQLSLIFVLFALPAGYVGGRLGRRKTIVSGIVLMGGLMALIYFLPVSLLITPLASLPALGVVPVLGILLMLAGAAWALININSLPMVVDMTVPARIGTYTGLYYLFSTLAAIVGPNVNGLIIQLTGYNYNAIMIVAPLFMLAALALIAGVRRGEATVRTAAVVAD
jgi:MFS-type transporter involved in bile tolerance (Atg22 family)